MAPLVVMIFWLGVYPNPVINKMEPSVKNLISVVEKGQASIHDDKFVVANAKKDGGVE